MNDELTLLSSEFRSRIEAILGREIKPEEYGSVRDLNEIPEHYIAELRRLSGVYDHLFLEYLWDSGPCDQAKSKIIMLFRNDVLSLRQDPRSWYHGGIFFPSHSNDAWLFQSSVAEILEDLAKKPDEPWVTFPVPEVLSESTLLCGAPCLFRPNETYRWLEQRDRNCTRITCYYGPIDGLEPIQDIMVATRRWLALQAAFAIEFDRLEGNPAELLRAKVPEIQTYSADVLIALQALHAERMFMPNEKRKLPGFRGPDAWYAGELPAGV